MDGLLRTGWPVAAIGAAAVGVVGYLGLVTGRLTLDLGVGRRTRALGPQGTRHRRAP